MMATARDCIEYPERFEWLRAALAARSLDPRDGILVDLRSVPDQGCWVHYGIWLTGSGRFHRFVVDEAFGARLLEASGRVEHVTIQDVTEEICTDDSVAGVGKSFGAMALQLLSALSQDGPRS
jgi:hypothetical protein